MLTQKMIAAVFCLVFLTVAVLVALGKAPLGDLVVLPGMFFAYLVDPKHSASILPPAPTSVLDVPPDPPPTVRDTPAAKRATLIPMFVALVAGGAMLGSDGCGAAQHAEADSLYASQVLACVDAAQTLLESKACRAKVKASWGLEGGAE